MILELLRNRYQSPEWAFFAEVGNGTGSQKSRSADAIAFNLWTSRGLRIDGFEIKASRSDWLNEKKNPQKAEEGMAYCDYRWLAVENDSVAKVEELPDGWGMFVERNGRLFELKKAEKSPYTKEVNRIFLAAVARRSFEEVMNDERIKTAYAEGSRAGVSRGKSIVESQINVLRKESEEWRGKFNAFARAIGFEDTDELRYVSPQEVATAIKLYTNNGIKYQVQSLRQIHERIGEILDGAEKILPIKSQEVRP